MQFGIEPASRLPIYQQLVQQVREAIARGDLSPDQQLPSVRQLSRESGDQSQHGCAGLHRARA